MKLPISLKISLRSILKNKTQSLISILGLGIGLGCVFLLLLLYINENSYDRSIPDKENLYRIIRGKECRTSYPLGKTLADENPFVKDFFRVYQQNEIEIKTVERELFSEKFFTCADASIYKCLGVKILKGTASKTADEVCISKSMAEKYFGTDDPINKTLQIKFIDEYYPLSICGVYKDFPTYSSLHPNFIGHLDLLEKSLPHYRSALGHYGKADDQFKDWNHADLHTYVLLKDEADLQQIVQSLKTYKNHTNNEEIKDTDYKLQAVSNIYLHSNDLGGNFFTRRGNPSELIYFLLISSLILIIAIINYAFLTKVKIESRMKDIGIQKAMGATKLGILKQILIETNLLAFISLAPASLIIYSGIPFLNNTLQRNLSIDVFALWESYVALLVVLIVTGSLSGLLIGFRVSKIPSVQLVKGITSKSIKRKTFGNSILIIHFTIFMILVVGIISIKKQLKFAQTTSQNITTENIIVCELNSPKLVSQFKMLTNEVLKIPGVAKVAGSSFIPPFKDFLPATIDHEGNKVRFDGLIMGKGMIDLLGIPVMEGEGFSEFNTERTELIFNESAALKYNIKAGSVFNGCDVRGIVKDFNAHSFKSAINPMLILQQTPDKMRLLVIKTISSNHLKLIQEKVNQLFKKIDADKIITIYSLQDQINDFYKTEVQQVKIISAFGFLAIILLVMGLLGMVLNQTQRKTKEIGVRKVNGAKTHQIMQMLNRDFSIWVLIAFAISCPISWYVMNKWLENFAFKTELSWWIFALAGIIAMGITLLTVSFQAWRAATRNPVESLRYE